MGRGPRSALGGSTAAAVVVAAWMGVVGATDLEAAQERGAEADAPPTELAGELSPGGALADSVSADAAPVRLAFPLPKTPAEIARDALPAVVEIITYRSGGEKLGGGSGFVVAPEGLVLTSHHVLEGAVRAEVVLQTGEVYDVVHVAGADARRDLVVLRVGGYGLPTVRLGDSRRISPGDPVVVIGSPLGLTNTVTHGLISAKRDFEGRRLLQISAPISSGSSGGPVFDERGRVVGVLAGFLRKGQNVNFAVPIEYARGLLALPSHTFTVESLGRKRISLLDGRTSARELSLQAVLRGEAIPGEEETPWALQPRRVDAEAVKAEPAAAPAELVGLWELRELTRVPGTRSGVYRGVLASDGTGLAGTFFGSLVRDPDFDRRFDADRVRGFEVKMEPGGRATLTGEHGCTYYVHASPAAMAGVYECVDERGSVYDVGAVEVRRIDGAGPSGVYRFVEETELGARRTRTTGKLLVLALPDGRWLGRLMTDGGRKSRLVELRDGRWTADGYLSGRLSGREPVRVRGTFEEDRLDLHYAVGGGDYAGEASLRGTREPPPVSPDEEPRPKPEREAEEAAEPASAPAAGGTPGPV